MDDEITTNTRNSYDRLADEYVGRIYPELQHKPFDRQLFDDFAARVRGPVCDLGCGPGHVARYLRNHGVSEVCGIDLSPELVERARRLNPGIEFQAGNMLALNIADATWAGIVAFYSIIHIPRRGHVAVFSEMERVLRPGGLLLVAFHVGEEIIHFDELWGQAVSNRYVTEEQRGRWPIFIATLRAARLSAGCFVAHRSQTTAGILPLRFAHPAKNTRRRRYTSHGLGALGENSNDCVPHCGTE